jgi:phage tail-like protein
MAHSGELSQQFDPIKNFRFRVKWEGRYVAGVSRLSALRRSTEVVSHNEGANPGQTRKSPGRTEYEAITLERGVTQDTEFEDWADRVYSFGTQRPGDPDFRKDVQIEVYDESGQLGRVYLVHRCWVSEFQAMPELDANANGVAIEQITLEHEGWERIDTASAGSARRVEGTPTT